MTAATSSTSAAFSPAFHDDDAEQTTGYRTLSVLAIISLVFGVLSWVALFHPLLIVVPLLGIGVAILALRQISTNPNVIAGRGAALAGLTLCVASLVAPTSRDMIFREIRTSQAKSTSRTFLELVTAGNMDEAFRHTYDGARPKSTPPPEPGAPPAPSKPSPLEAFITQPVVARLKAIGPDAKIRFLGTDLYEAYTYRNISIKQRYSATPASGGEPFEVLLTIQRTQIRGESMSRWMIVKVDDAKAPAATTPDQQTPASS
jgi:hypothetical protein